MSLMRLINQLGAGFGYQQGPTHAWENYNLSHSRFLTMQPRMAYQYYVDFLISADAEELVERNLGKKDRSNSLDSLSPFVKEISLPSFTIETERLNEYNQPRISHTRLNREPIIIKMWDTVDGSIMQLWKSYYEYNFKDGLFNEDNATDKLKLITADVNSVNWKSSYAGLNLDKISDREKDGFFYAIRIALTQGQKEQEIMIFNPKITAFSSDSLSYSESRLVELTFTIEYENVLYGLNSYKTSKDNLKRYKKGKYLGLPTVAISALINDALSSINPLANSSNPFVRAVGSVVQGKITSVASNAVSNAASNLATGATSSIGKISPGVTQNISNSSPVIPNTGGRDFKPRVG